jgi:hypothetical protein
MLDTNTSHQNILHFGAKKKRGLRIFLKVTKNPINGQIMTNLKLIMIIIKKKCPPPTLNLIVDKRTDAFGYASPPGKFKFKSGFGRAILWRLRNDRLERAVCMRQREKHPPLHSRAPSAVDEANAA